MKILFDMNIPYTYSALFKKRGVDTLRWSDVGAPNAEDLEIMGYARDHDYVILTCDLDFSAILSATHELKPSVVQIRASVLNAEHAVDVIIAALLQNSDSLKKGAILSIDIKKARFRLLPL